MNVKLSLGLAALTLLLAGAEVAAQTQIVRGDIDGIQGTNRFQLDCTSIELISTSVNLQALHDLSRQQNIEFEMQVSVASVSPTVLNVLSAVQIPETMDMGKMRLGETDNWEVRGQPGTAAFVFIGDRRTTAYIPAGPLGTFVLGGPIALLASGTINGVGQFQFNFTMPNNPLFVGVEITSQAILALPSGMLTITHPACKTIEA
jgi:hypothetical protein